MENDIVKKASVIIHYFMRCERYEQKLTEEELMIKIFLEDATLIDICLLWKNETLKKLFDKCYDNINEVERLWEEKVEKYL